MMKTLCKIVILLASVGLMSAGCGRQMETPAPRITPDAELMDVSLLTGEPCGPPCWYGLIPGESTFDEAWEVLEELPFVDSSTLTSSGIENIIWHNRIGSMPGRAGGNIAIGEGNRVEYITYGLEYYLELQEMIALRGEPSGFTVSGIGPTGGAPDLYAFDLIWPENGLMATVDIDNEDFRVFYQIPPLNPGTPISSATYFEPASSVQELAEADSLPWLHGLIETGRYYEWNGYQPLPTPEP